VAQPVTGKYENQIEKFHYMRGSRRLHIAVKRVTGKLPPKPGDAWEITKDMVCAEHLLGRVDARWDGGLISFD
jgi:hypothetical protein